MSAFSLGVRWCGRAGVAAALSAGLMLATGCETETKTDAGGGLKGPQPTLPTPPAYAVVAPRYNLRTALLPRLWGRAQVQVRYTDERGEKRFEQGEGFLSMEQPGKVALSIGKLGETLFWIGSNAERYWSIDLTGKPPRAYVGRHDGPARQSATRNSLAEAVSPRDLARLMAIESLPMDGGGTEWSADGKLLGLTGNYASEDGRRSRRQRVWVDPKSLEPRAVELFDVRGQVAVRSELRALDFVAAPGVTGVGPKAPSETRITHTATGSSVTLVASGMDASTRRIRADAFDLAKVMAALGVRERTDLDAGGSPRVPLVDAPRLRPVPPASKPGESSEPATGPWSAPSTLPKGTP